MIENNAKLLHNKALVNVNSLVVWMLFGVFGVGTIEYLIAGVLPQRCGSQ